jgi:signal transduction histidine kinase
LVNRHDDPSDELTQLRARVSELEAELRIRDEFIIAAAHELRNPISPLVLQVQRLHSAARDARDGAVPATWLNDQCTQLAKRLGRFTSALNRILDVSRLHSGRVDLVLEDGVDLSEVTREVAASFERELLASRSELSLELPERVLGSWDRMRLDQIVGNLVSNAIRYGNSKPIRVSLSHTSESARLVVHDQGIGIALEDQVRIFERFERGATRNRAGFGVGLWIVRQLCEAMGGSVSVDSSPGEGAQFCVVLPLKKRRSDDDR